MATFDDDHFVAILLKVDSNSIFPNDLAYLK